MPAGNAWSNEGVSLPADHAPQVSVVLTVAILPLTFGLPVTSPVIGLIFSPLGRPVALNFRPGPVWEAAAKNTHR